VVDCPTGYYEVNETHECLLCSDYCMECGYEHNNCSSCQESGSYESYLLEN
jgi:ferredoxin-like protein FixX